MPVLEDVWSSVGDRKNRDRVNSQFNIHTSLKTEFKCRKTWQHVSIRES